MKRLFALAIAIIVAFALLSPGHYVTNPCPQSHLESIPKSFDDAQFQQLMKQAEYCSSCSKSHT
ncbi:hypothetical protein [Vibrio barjaei]|uniref:hypothetical protein n=1 Tax=Vibrio barjaei TaxID=1676683 RepID=UPI0022850E1B|nr:hypothetical protein [Vibrio barjaei]MCY9873028.1 hypothetical protein [Vibrio barjaei]